jgi:hypothetical protein
MKRHMKIALKPFTVPNYVIGEAPPRPRQDGWQEPPKWELGELDADTLSELCDDFRAAVFEKAGAADPRKAPR